MSTEATDDPALLASRPVSTRRATTPQEIEWMLFCCAHNSQFFTDVRALIQPEHMYGDDLFFRLTYEGLIYCHENYGGVTFENLRMSVENRLAMDDTIFLPLPKREQLFSDGPPGFLYEVCHPDASTQFVGPNLELARTILAKFAEERLVHHPLIRFLDTTRQPNGALVPDRLNQFIDSINTTRARLASTNAVPLVDLTPAVGSPLRKSHEYTKTGFKFFDDALGGQVRGDVNGIIGPTGGGKTTMGIHLAACMSKQCWADGIAAGVDPECVYYVTVEEAAIRLRPRIWSTYFQIQRSRLEQMDSWDYLSQPGGELIDYEIKAQANQEHKLSEIERYQLHSPSLSRCFKLLDLSGSAEFPDAGDGYIAEIVSNIARLDLPPRAVFIDYAGLLCERYAAIMNYDEFGYRRLLKNFAQQCRKEISERFNCVTWLLHQLRSDLGNASPGKLMHHTYAQDCKSFANNMSVCGILSPRDPKTDVCRWNWSKNRHRPNSLAPPAFLRINDTYAQFDDVTQFYCVPAAGHGIITMAEANAVQATDAATERSSQRGPANLRNTARDPLQEAAAHE